MTRWIMKDTKHTFIRKNQNKQEHVYEKKTKTR